MFKISSTVNFLLLANFLCFSSCTNSKENNQVKIQNKNTGDLSVKYNLNKIKLPPGFQISVYAEVPNARSMALSPSGIIYAGNRNGNKVFAIVDEDKDGKADKVYCFNTFCMPVM